MSEAFEKWWADEGSTPPAKGDDIETHTMKKCRIAWENGAYVNEAERDALKLRVGDLEQAFNYIKSELKEVHTVNCYPPINNYDPVIINVLKVCEVVLKNKLEASDNEQR